MWNLSKLKMGKLMEGVEMSKVVQLDDYRKKEIVVKTKEELYDAWLQQFMREYQVERYLK